MLNKSEKYSLLDDMGLNLQQNSRYTHAMLDTLIGFLDNKTGEIDELNAEIDELLDETEQLKNKICHCRSPNCIVKDRDSFLSYFNRQVAESYLNDDSDTCFHCAGRDSVATVKTTTTYGIDEKQLFANHLCGIIKTFIKNQLYIKTTENVNNDIYKKYKIIEKKYDDGNVENTKLRIYMGKNLKEISNLKQRLKDREDIYREELKEKNTELKKLRKLNTKLVKMVTLEKEPEEEEEEQEEEEQIEEIKISKISDDSSKIISIYEQAKLYLYDKQLSLSDIAFRNKVNKNNLINKYLSLKWSRIKICHPEVIKIKSDDEFLELL